MDPQALFVQFTWSLGMYAQTTLVLVVGGYVLRRVGPAGRLSTTFPGALGEPRSGKGGWRRSALAFALLSALYLLEFVLLRTVHAAGDDTAVDWALVVPLLGVLFVGPLAGVPATLVAMFVRADTAFADGADADSLEALGPAPSRWLDTRFWLEEHWIWLEPGVVAVGVGAALAVLVHLRYRDLARAPLAIGVPLAVAFQGTYLAVADARWGRESALELLRVETVPSMTALALVVAVLVLAVRAARSERDRVLAREAAERSREASFERHDAQIDPHFLSNALNAVAGVSVTSPERARELLGALGAHYRERCDGGRPSVTLRHELAAVRDYVAIESARHGERLQVRERISPDCLDARLPRLSLQPLVENAIRHGGTGRRAVRVTIRARLERDTLRVSVDDDGPGPVGPLDPTAFGTGLANVRARLRHLHGVRAELVLEPVAGGGTVARLGVPQGEAHPSRESA